MRPESGFIPEHVAPGTSTTEFSRSDVIRRSSWSFRRHDEDFASSSENVHADVVTVPHKVKVDGRSGDFQIGDPKLGREGGNCGWWNQSCCSAPAMLRPRQACSNMKAEPAAQA